MPLPSRLFARATLALFWLTVFTSATATQRPAPDSDPFYEGFLHPPVLAKPLVYWHWMDGNISREGIAEDLKWMDRVGLGGFVLFEAGMGTPLILDHRVSYMSEEWKTAFRFTANLSAQLGLQMGVAASPGWSATGGPWVTPRDGMKKLVWSEIIIPGARAFTGTLPVPPRVTGPYQDVPLSAVERVDPATTPPTFYADAAVIAYRLPQNHDEVYLHPVGASSSAGRLDAGKLGDGRFGEAIHMVLAPNTTAWAQLDFAQPTTVRSVQIGAPGLHGFGTSAPPELMLQASDDGATFRDVTNLPSTASPVRSASFAPVRARYFRVLFSPSAQTSFIDSLRVPNTVALPAFARSPDHYDISQFRLYSAARVTAAEEKAGFATSADYYSLDTPPASFTPLDLPIEVMNLTKKMRPDGSLEWTPPPGRWVVQRFGFSLTGHENGPAPTEATGLEVDKLDGTRVTAYLDTYLGKFERILETDTAGIANLKFVESDSIESGPQNWTDSMVEEFKQRRGYDLLRWMPALTGVILESPESTDRFLWDFRRTIAELVAEKHYAAIALAAHQRGLDYYAEALEDHRPQLGDDMEMRSHADMPMGAMWMNPQDEPPMPTYVADLQGAASVAHIYGKPIVGAESFTSFGMPWALAPRDLKSRADLEMALGVNRFVIHTSTHQPLIGDKKPGLALAPFLGQYFNRNETWAEMAGAWVTYLSRSSFLLQQGHFEADVAYFYGEEAPLTSLYGDALAPMPSGYDFDFVNADALEHCLSVHEGSLENQGRTRYRVLYLGGTSRRMTLAAMRKVKQLLEAGAHVVGLRPLGSPSLGDDNAEFQRLADSIWNSRPESLETLHVGSGLLIPSADLGMALSVFGMEPQWSFRRDTPNAQLAVLHRQLPDGDLFFVSNRSNGAESGILRLRVTGKTPQIWRADSGAVETASYAREVGYTAVHLDMVKDDAVFVVMRDRLASPAAQPIVTPVESIAPVRGPWILNFESRPGSPPAETLTTLKSWTDFPDSSVRYYSGVGTYTTTVRVSDKQISAHSLQLDLGEVGDLAVVSINGRTVATLWHAPFRMDITGSVHRGNNALLIKVANLWQNRLIGDAQSGAEKQAFTTGTTYLPTAPLRPSGLLGPVRLFLVP